MRIPNATLTVDVTLEALIFDQQVSVELDCFIFCGECHGHRTIQDWRGQRPCSKCKGEGGHYERDAFTANLTPGIIDINGFTCRFDKRGHQLGKEYRSDLELTVNVLPHATFKPKGKDLVCDVSISPLQAMFGGEVIFPALRGSSTKYVDNPGEGHWKSEGEGGFVSGDKTRGNIIYRFVTVPSKQRTEQKAVARIHELKTHVQEKEDTITRQETQHQQALREQAERFESLKVSMQAQASKEIQDAATQATLSLAKALLPSLDSLEKALAAMDTPADSAHRQGIEMILDMQRQTLEQHGIKRVPALGETFDPHLHEAVAMDMESDTPKNTVTEVLQTGYKHKGKLLQAAMVKVSGSA